MIYSPLLAPVRGHVRLRLLSMFWLRVAGWWAVMHRYWLNNQISEVMNICKKRSYKLLCHFPPVSWPRRVGTKWGVMSANFLISRLAPSFDGTHLAGLKHSLAERFVFPQLRNGRTWLPRSAGFAPAPPLFASLPFATTSVSFKAASGWPRRACAVRTNGGHCRFPGGGCKVHYQSRSLGDILPTTCWNRC